MNLRDYNVSKYHENYINKKSYPILGMKLTYYENRALPDKYGLLLTIQHEKRRDRMNRLVNGNDYAVFLPRVGVKFFRADPNQSAYSSANSYLNTMAPYEIAQVSFDSLLDIYDDTTTTTFTDNLLYIQLLILDAISKRIKVHLDRIDQETIQQGINEANHIYNKVNYDASKLNSKYGQTYTEGKLEAIDRTLLYCEQYLENLPHYGGKYKRTQETYKDAQGKARVVYVKGREKFVKRKNKTSNKLEYCNVKHLKAQTK